MTWTKACSFIHFVWSLCYIIIGAVQLITGVCFFITIPLFRLGSNIFTGGWNIIFGVGGIVFSMIGKWAVSKERKFLYMSVAILSANVIDLIILEVGEWHFFMSEPIKKTIAEEDLTNIVLYAGTITTWSTVMAAIISFIDLQLTFCIIQIYQLFRATTPRKLETDMDNEYNLSRMKDEEETRESVEAFTGKQAAQSWVFETQGSDSITTPMGSGNDTTNRNSFASSNTVIDMTATRPVSITMGMKQTRESDGQIDVDKDRLTEGSNNRDNDGEVSCLANFPRAPSPNGVDSNSTGPREKSSSLVSRPQKLLETDFDRSPRTHYYQHENKNEGEDMLTRLHDAFGIEVLSGNMSEKPKTTEANKEGKEESRVGLSKNQGKKPPKIKDTKKDKVLNDEEYLANLQYAFGVRTDHTPSAAKLAASSSKLKTAQLKEKFLYQHPGLPTSSYHQDSGDYIGDAKQQSALKSTAPPSVSKIEKRHSPRSTLMETHFPAIKTESMSIESDLEYLRTVLEPPSLERPKIRSVLEKCEMIYSSSKKETAEVRKEEASGEFVRQERESPITTAGVQRGLKDFENATRASCNMEAKDQQQEMVGQFLGENKNEELEYTPVTTAPATYFSKQSMIIEKVGEEEHLCFDLMTDQMEDDQSEPDFIPPPPLLPVQNERDGENDETDTLFVLKSESPVYDGSDTQNTDNDADGLGSDGADSGNDNSTGKETVIGFKDSIEQISTTIDDVPMDAYPELLEGGDKGNLHPVADVEFSLNEESSTHTGSNNEFPPDLKEETISLTLDGSGGNVAAAVEASQNEGNHDEGKNDGRMCIRDNFKSGGNIPPPVDEE